MVDEVRTHFGLDVDDPFIISNKVQSTELVGSNPNIDLYDQINSRLENHYENRAMEEAKTKQKMLEGYLEHRKELKREHEDKKALEKEAKEQLMKGNEYQDMKSKEKILEYQCLCATLRELKEQVDSKTKVRIVWRFHLQGLKRSLEKRLRSFMFRQRRISMLK